MRYSTFIGLASVFKCFLNKVLWHSIMTALPPTPPYTHISHGSLIKVCFAFYFIHDPTNFIMVTASEWKLILETQKHFISCVNDSSLKHDHTALCEYNKENL